MQNRSDCVKLREQWLINRPAHLGKNQLKWELINLNLFLSLWKLEVISVEECDRCEETLIRGWSWLIGQGGREKPYQSFDRCMLSQRKPDFRVDSNQIRTEERETI